MYNAAQLVRYFQSEYTGGYGISSKGLMLPTCILPYTEQANPDQVPDEVLTNAQAVIEYYDDVPCIEGVPIYERISGEPVPYYNLFVKYRDLTLQYPTRSMARLSEVSGIEIPTIRTLAHMWHWQHRVTAFDEQQKKDLAWKRQKEAEKLDSLLSKKGRDTIEMAFAYLETHENQLDPKQAIELLKIITPIARVATGLPKEAPIEAGFGSRSGSGGGGDINVNIANNNASGANSSVHGLAASEVIAKTEKQAEDVGYLAGVLNVLNQSGAFEREILEQRDALEVEFTVEEE